MCILLCIRDTNSFAILVNESASVQSLWTCRSIHQFKQAWHVVVHSHDFIFWSYYQLSSLWTCRSIRHQFKRACMACCCTQPWPHPLKLLSLVKFAAGITSINFKLTTLATSEKSFPHVSSEPVAHVRRAAKLVGVAVFKLCVCINFEAPPLSHPCPRPCRLLVLYFSS